MNFDDQLEILYRLKSLARYSTRMTLKDESVAEHSFYVAILSYMISKKLSEKKDVDVSKTVMIGLFHDIPEIYLGDIPHSTKRRFPAVNEELDKAEANIRNNLFTEDLRKYCEEHEEGKSIESKIVKLADVVSAYMYTKNEISLGNNTLNDLLAKVEDRMKVLAIELGVELEELKLVLEGGINYD